MKNIIVTALFLLLSTNAFACYDESLSDRANFDNCLVEAEQGHAKAQYNLGVMYRHGRGVTQGVTQFEGYATAKEIARNYKEASKWYRKAAEQGNEDAQYNLGVMYGEGKGVTQDQKIAHMWFNIAAANEIPRAAELRDIMAQEMTPSQIEKAQDMAREWMAEH